MTIEFAGDAAFLALVLGMLTLLAAGIPNRA